jgi:hypothetical protein
MNPFDMSKNILKKETKLSREIVETDTSAFMLNKIFSNDMQFCLVANELNRTGFTNRMVYDCYYHGLPKSGKYIKYSSKKAQVDKEIKYLMEYYKCNQNIAKQYMKLISPEDKAMIVDFFEKRGIKR